MTFTLTKLFKAGYEAFTTGSKGKSAGVNQQRESGAVIPLYADNTQSTSSASINSVPVEGATLARPAHYEVRAGGKPQQVFALTDDPRVVVFREYDHAGAGYRDAMDGANGEWQELCAGRHQLHFDHILERVMLDRQARIGEAEMRLLDVGQQASPLAEARLRKFIEHLNNDIAELQRQRELAAQSKGWYGVSRSQYLAGFRRRIAEVADLRGLID